MLRLRYWSWIGLLGGSLLAGSACAPVAAPEVGEARTLPAENPPTPATLSSKGSAAPDILRQRIELAIHSVRERELLTTHGFWTIFHGILGLGPQQTFLKDPRTGQQYNALDYICSGNPVRGLEFLPTPYGLDVRSATTPELVFVAQGHQDQFIAEMAQWGMPLDREFLVQGKTYHFRDFVRQAQMRASLRPGPDGKQQELSWTILIIGQYLGTEAEWTNQYGEHLRLADLLEYELNQPMQTAACGGTHRLFDLSWVYQLHRRRGGKQEGIWQRIADNAVRYQALARQWQNADGSFSTDFFNGPGQTPDPERRINTTGHIFEWLSLSLPDAQLRAPWVQEAANALSQMILNVGREPVEGGTLYHAVHGLIIYHARLYDPEKLTRELAALPLP
jgi:hypothetical protein